MGAINDFSEAGYEVNVNFGPVIAKEGWQREHAGRFGKLDATAKAQLAAEIIFLTRAEWLHEVNLSWRPGGERLLLWPEIQERKRRSWASGEKVLHYTGRFEATPRSGVPRAPRRTLSPYRDVRHAF